MAHISTYLANKLLDHSLRNTAYTPPATVYLGLHLASPGIDGSGAEVTGGGYARISVTFSAASSRATSNSSTLTFAKATSAWGTVTDFGIWDAASAGNLMVFGSLTASRAISSGETMTVDPGDIDVDID